MVLWVGQSKSYDASATDSLVCKGYKGIGSDGQYLYYAPYYDGSNYHGRVLREKIYTVFGNSSTWEAYDAGTTDSLTCKGFSGAIFDGQFMYFVPEYNGAYHGIVLRYDTTKPFKNSGSWDAYNAGSVDSLTTKGFKGAVFDGHFIYFIPAYNGAYHGNVLRYDTTKPFKSSGSWEAYNCGSLNAGFYGGVYVEPFVYLSPWKNGKIVRLDTTKPFKSSGSWVAYDVSTINAGLKKFGGPCSNGRYVYYPNLEGELALRYDTERPLTDANSYKTFNPNSLMDGAYFIDCCIQDHFLILSPYQATAAVHDMDLPFDNVNSWTMTIIMHNHHTKFGWHGSHADPNYVYFSPFYPDHPAAYHGVVSRIRVAPCPTQTPPQPGESEDLREYLILDEGNNVSTTETKATASSVASQEFASCFFDYGYNFFDAIEIYFEMCLTSIIGTDSDPDPFPAYLYTLCLSNKLLDGNLDTIEDFGINDVNVAFEVRFNEDGSIYSRKIVLVKGPRDAMSSGFTISEDTTYYCKLARTAGSATISLYIYSDANRTNLLSTKSISSFPTSAKWRLIYALRGKSEPDILVTASWWTQNIEIADW